MVLTNFFHANRILTVLVLALVIGGCASQGSDVSQDEDASQDEKPAEELGSDAGAFPVETLEFPEVELIEEQDAERVAANPGDAMHAVVKDLGNLSHRSRSSACLRWSEDLARRIRFMNPDLFVETASRGDESGRDETLCAVLFMHKDAFAKTAIGYALNNLPWAFDNPLHHGSNPTRLPVTWLIYVEDSGTFGVADFPNRLHFGYSDFKAEDGRLTGLLMGRFRASNVRYWETEGRRSGLIFEGGSVEVYYHDDPYSRPHQISGVSELVIFHRAQNLNGKDSGRYWLRLRREYIPLRPAEE